MSAQDVVLPDAAIAVRLRRALDEARDLADLLVVRPHLAMASAWVQQVILGAGQALEVVERNASGDDEVISRARMMGHYIWTASGGRFFPQDPRASEVKLTDIAWALANVMRWSGHANPAISVGWHSLFVGRIAKRIAQEESANEDEAFLYGLLHDAHEAYLPDVARPILEYLSPDILRMRDEVQSVILVALGIPPASPVIAGIVDLADDYAQRFEAEALFPRDLCDPADIGKEPPAYLRDGDLEFTTMQKLLSHEYWQVAVEATVAKLRAAKPELVAHGSWRDQALVIEADTYCRVCVRDGWYVPVASAGLCEACGG